MDFDTAHVYSVLPPPTTIYTPLRPFVHHQTRGIGRGCRQRWKREQNMVVVMRILLVAAFAIVSGVATTSAALLTQACSKTRYPSLCLSSLSGFPGATTATAAGHRDLVHFSLDVTLQRVGKALYGGSTVANLHMDTLVRAAYEDCMELLEDTEYHLSRSLEVVSPSSPAKASDEDLLTWLSAAVTNQDTCMESLNEVPGGEMKNHMLRNVKDLSELVSNSLAIFANVRRNKDFNGIPIENRRRRLMGFPSWVGRKERRLLQMPASSLKPDFVVSKDGNGTHETITAAVKAAPKNSTRRIIVYIKAGRYDENVKVGRKKMNMMFVGESKSNTIIAGCRSVFDNFTTFHTATFAATGAGFIARDITFENWAGPAKHQAVALRVGADHAVVYRCNVIGYQDSLYVHSLRQFFRECDIYGTIDFIFGNAAVVFQNCSIYARKPMENQKNTITAQNRKDPNQNTGISIHACRILAHYDLQPVSSSFPTFLGRPWKLYSRTVYMLSYMSNHIHPQGWLPWRDTYALDTLFYGEYMNYGPGSALARRVTWPGYRVINTTEAAEFTVGRFITGSSWLPSTGVAFLAGLST